MKQYTITFRKPVSQNDDTIDMYNESLEIVFGPDVAVDWRDAQTIEIVTDVDIFFDHNV